METECCPRFNPKPWDGNVFTWRDKKFIKARVLCLFHIPLNFGSVITALNKKVDASGAKVKDWMCLSDDTSMWNMDIFLAVDKEVPGLQNVTISGKFLSKTYEGPFQDTGKWCKDFEAYARKKGFSIKRWFMWYTTCPKCAKKYGKNPVVIVGKVK